MKTMTVSGSGVRYLGGGATTGNATATCSGEGGVVMETIGGGGEGRVVMDTVGGLSGCPCLREEGTPVVFDLK